LLARREHSRQELGTKLSQKGHSPQFIDLVLTELVEQNLLSDVRFAEAYVRMRGYGPKRIMAELQQRGVGEAEIHRALLGCEIDWLSLVQTLFERKFGSEQDYQFEDRAKQWRYLYNRGFDSDLIREVVGNGYS